MPFTGAGISTECGIPDFRSPGGIWTKNRPIPFDEFLASQEARNESWRRRFAMGDEFGRRQAGPRASGARQPLSRRQGAGGGDAEHRQSASSLWHRARTRRRIARQHDLRPVPRLRAALRTRLGAPADGSRQRLRARLSGLRRPHQDRDGIVRSSDAGCRNAACPGSHLVLRSVSGDRFLARGLAGGRISLDGQAQRRAIWSSSTASRPTSTTSPTSWCGRTSARCSRRSSTARHPPMFTGCDAFGSGVAILCFPRGWRCYLRFERFVKRPRRGRQQRQRPRRHGVGRNRTKIHRSGAWTGRRSQRRGGSARHRSVRRHQMVRCRQGLRLHRSRQWHGRRASARDLSAPRRLSDRL